MGPSGCHGHQRTTRLMDGQVPGMRVLTRKAASSQGRPKVGEVVLLEVMSLQVFPQETPTVEQAVLGMHVWVRGSEWVMMAESRIVLGMRTMTRKAASSQR